MNLIQVYKYLTTAKTEHYLYFTIENYRRYRFLIYFLLMFNKHYISCKIFRKEHKYHKNIVVVGLKYYGRTVKRRTNGYAKEYLDEYPDSNCPYCNTTLNNDNITADHIIAVSKGGNNAKINLLCSCKKCNEERGDEDFYKYLFQKQPKYKQIKYPFI